MLKDITDRYSELDFSDNSDIDKKVELIKDIEILIEDETKKGEGLNSKNADIRQIFVELQNIVDDIENENIAFRKELAAYTNFAIDTANLFVSELKKTISDVALRGY